MRTTFRLKHEPDYYRGLGFLLASCLALVWALWRDAFTPQVFLAGFLCFSWGYAFLWRYDLNQRLSSLRAEVDELKKRLEAAKTGEEEVQEAVEAQEIPADLEAAATEPASATPEANASGE
ncbi:MAG: hypothetical protein ACUVRM_02930 [Bacillota bacterium]